MSLETLLLEAGEKLLDPQPVVKLLELLDRVSLYLSMVEQDPSDSMENALSSLKQTLVDERLLKHSDVDVKVAITCCIVEFMRITAPHAPYDDEKMKEVFQLIVSSFEHLADRSSSSYVRRTSILNIVARVSMSVVMLDLEFDALIIDMFQHFLNSLRDHHRFKVSLDMENVMSLVLQESDDIPPELLSPILHYLRKDAEVPQVSRKLAEKVLINSATKLEMYLSEAVESSGVSLDKYISTVASICDGTFNEAIEVSTPERTCLPKRRVKLEGHSHKRARVESYSLDNEMEKIDSEGEPSYPTHKSSPEPGDCSMTHLLAKVRQSIVETITSLRQFGSELETKEQNIVDTLTSVRQFRSEIKKKLVDNLEASLQEVDVLGEKILGTHDQV